MAAEKNWKPLELVKVTADYLSGKGVPNARLDAEILLCRAMELERRIDLYAGFEREIPPDRLIAFRALVKRRAGREPVSRILGEREFMGLRMEVNPSVLSPRPETELLVEAAVSFFRPARQPAVADEDPPDGGPADDPAALDKILDQYAEDAGEDDLEAPSPVPETPTLRQAARSGSWRGKKKPAAPPAAAAGEAPVGILDLGTGSGCIAVAIAVMLPTARIVAVDVSPDALCTAERNAEAAGVAGRIEFRLGDWLRACGEGETFDAILSNPPYLVEGDPEIWPEVAGFDPAAALYGGPDGLDAYRAIAARAGRHLRAGGMIFLEVGAGQARAVRDLLAGGGFEKITVGRDYAGIERMVSGVAP